MKGVIMNKVSYNISGIRNTQMKTQLKNVLTGLDGVQKLDIDLGKGSIEVGYNNSTSETAIRDGIEQVGCRIV